MQRGFCIRPKITQPTELKVNWTACQSAGTTAGCVGSQDILERTINISPERALLGPSREKVKALNGHGAYPGSAQPPLSMRMHHVSLRWGFWKASQEKDNQARPLGWITKAGSARWIAGAEHRAGSWPKLAPPGELKMGSNSKREKSQGRPAFRDKTTSRCKLPGRGQ